MQGPPLQRSWPRCQRDACPSPHVQIRGTFHTTARVLPKGRMRPPEALPKPHCRLARRASAAPPPCEPASSSAGVSNGSWVQLQDSCRSLHLGREESEGRSDAFGIRAAPRQYLELADCGEDGAAAVRVDHKEPACELEQRHTRRYTLVRRLERVQRRQIVPAQRELA